jgi:F-box/WD-40 domain protein MET30
MRGHSRAVRALQFDEAKLITASMDRTLKVWDWRSGKCIRTLEGHTEGVVCLNFGSDLLASGSVDTTVKVWNFRTGECFTLRGHKDWVNAVILWDGQDKPNKMLFSASDDGTVRLWDLALRVCVRQFEGHVGQVQSIQVITVDQSSEEPPREEPMSDASSSTYDLSRSATPAHDDELKALAKRSGPTSILISGSLDNTIRIWDVDTAICTQTLFGHIEGVWAVACDKLRLVSASHDRTIKVRLTISRFVNILTLL